MPLTADGLTTPTLADIQAQIAEDIHSGVDPALDLSSDSPDGEIVAIFASHAREVYEAIQDLYGLLDPANAEDALLENTSALTGTFREPATASTVAMSLTLGASFSAAIGTLLVSVEDHPDRIFANTAEVTSTTAGVYTGQPFAATTLGPVAAPSGTLTVITPVAGWTAANNPLDADVGTDIETDVALRERREIELAAQGSSSVDAIRARLLRIEGVLAAVVYENTTDTTDAEGRPPHSIEAVLHAPDVDDDDIAQVLWDHHGGGIPPHGSDSGNAIDSLGNSRNVKFSRAVERAVWITLTKWYNLALGVVPTAEIEARIIAEGEKLLVGDDVSMAKLLGAAVATPGLTNVTLFKLGFGASPSGSTDLAIGEREIATFDTARIAVTDPFM